MGGTISTTIQILDKLYLDQSQESIDEHINWNVDTTLKEASRAGPGANFSVNIETDYLSAEYKQNRAEIYLLKQKICDRFVYRFRKGISSKKLQKINAGETCCLCFY